MRMADIKLNFKMLQRSSFAITQRGRGPSPLYTPRQDEYVILSQVVVLKKSNTCFKSVRFRINRIYTCTSTPDSM